MPKDGRTLPASAICDAFDLGTPVAEMTPVTGGLTHRMWRLATDRGVFAVKDIAEEWPPTRVERAFVLERAALDAGIPVPAAVANPVTGGCIAEVARPDGLRANVRVHEWVDGEGLRRIVYGADYAGRVAAVVAKIHALNIAGGESIADALAIGGEEHWSALAEDAERSTVEWRWEMRGLLPVVRELEAYIESSHGDPMPLIMGHRDADQKNWMKTPAGELLLVDWDAAGPVHPRHEVANLALTWAGVHLGEPDWNVARAWIAAYREAGGALGRIVPGDLAEFVIVTLGWFEYSVRRAIDPGDDGERKAASDLVRRGFKDLPRVLRSIERWERVLGEE